MCSRPAFQRLTGYGPNILITNFEFFQTDSPHFHFGNRRAQDLITCDEKLFLLHEPKKTRKVGNTLILLLFSQLEAPLHSNAAQGRRIQEF